jgi:TPR repeat protein
MLCFMTGSALSAQARAQEPMPPEQARLSCSSSAGKALPGDYNFCLGHKYWEAGKYESARRMLELAAGWGNKAAQRALGVALFNGDGLATDKPLGLAWLALAAERKDEVSAGLYNSALDLASRTDRAAGADMLAQLRQRYADDVAALRADNRFQRTVRQMASNPVYGRGKCLEGAGGLPPGAAMDQAAEGAGSCSMAADDRFIASLEQRYEVYSRGWAGRRVELGAPEVVKEP